METPDNPAHEITDSTLDGIALDLGEMQRHIVWQSSDPVAF